MKPINLLQYTLFLILGLCVVSSTRAVTVPSSTVGTSRETLEQQIQNKAKDLERITQEIEEKNQNLKETKDERVSLQRDLGSLEKNIKQLSLNMKAGEITIEKLRLEIESLSYDLEDVSNSVMSKREAVQESLRTIQKNDSKNLLAIVLTNKSLVESVSEAQAMRNIQEQLLSDIGSLRALHERYERILEESGQKKKSVTQQQKDLENRKLIVEDQREERAELLQATKNKESLYQQQLNELKKKQQQIADEIEALDSILRTKIDPSLLPAVRPGVLAMPLAATRSDLTQDYGATAFAQYGYKGKWHNGIDIGAALGEPVFAAEEGTVVAVGNQDSYCPRGAYGRFIVVNHSNNLTSLYAHLSRTAVQKGDAVSRGQTIGYAGKTGYATGPHLHFTIFAQPTFYMGTSKTCGPMPHGGDLNPLMYL